MKYPGPVALVGSGPGDPDLITIRGRDRLAAADVVIYDELAGKALLGFCREGCECIHVGKRCGSHAATQSMIIDLMLEHARRGRRVVRLKGGDPFVFGRGGEELGALIQAGIPAEVVPGVTAACAAGAAAGVPLTHRQISSAVVFITGHENPDKPELAVDWGSYASLRATLCIYMGGRRLSRIAEQLIGGGMSVDTPVALVSCASLPDQQVSYHRLMDLPAIPLEKISLPVMAIVGEVASSPTQARDVAALAVASQATGGG